MYFVQEAMNDRRNENTDGTQESDTAEDGVKTCKPFGCIVLQHIHRTHTRQNHRSIEHCVDEWQPRGEHIATDPDAQGR